tara:strand:+ start:1912 stop:2139 length:228 start_codon:yes stop_codon:yes gene_type:complete
VKQLINNGVSNMYKVYTSDKILSSQELKDFKAVTKWINQFLYIHNEQQGMDIPISDLRVKDLSSGKVFNVTPKAT